MPKYLITLERTLTYTTQISLRAKDEDAARQKAQEKFYDIPESQWDEEEENVEITDIDLED